MAEMADAQARDLEDEDRIAVRLHAAEGADVGRHVAHIEVADGQGMLGRAALRVPAGQHMGDRRVGIGRVVGRMRLVHRDDVRHRAARKAGIVGGRHHPAGALDQIGRVGDIGDGHLVRRRGEAWGGRIVHRDIGCPRQVFGHGDAGARHHLGGGRRRQGKAGEKRGEGDEAVHGRAPGRLDGRVKDRSRRARRACRAPRARSSRAP